MSKSLVVIATALAGVFVATVADAQGITRRRSAGTRTAGVRVESQDSSSVSSSRTGVVLEQLPKVGRVSTLSAPTIQGASVIGPCYTKPRKWIVLESKYKTDMPWTDRLVFTWHVLLETSTATERQKGDKEKIAPYSYFSTTVSYVNVPKGSHAACVCLPPSYLERYGEPKAIGLVITSPEGEMLAGDSASEIKGIKSHTEWWKDTKVMDAKQNGEPMIERRQGLVDRSKTLWALVNPNDYEMIAQ